MSSAAPAVSAGSRPDGLGRPWALICGGGTAGHVVPALAIGRALIARGHDPSTIHYVGARHGIEGRLVPDAGFTVTLLPGRGIQRKLTVDNVRSVAGMALAAIEGTALVARHRPAVIVAVGGYASVPGVLAATALRVPMVVVEQNAAPGATNRAAARLARAAAVSFAGTPLPRAVLTGNPVRPEILAVDRSPSGQAAARATLGIPAASMVVLAFGGSLGARTINQSVLGLAERWHDRADLAIYHVVGSRDWESVLAACPKPHDGGLWYRQVRYEDRMELAYASADVAVCRAGASTVSELAVVGLPAVLVPLPGAPNDHQTANATAMVAAGGARLVADGDATPDRLAHELDGLADPARRRAMASGAATIAHPDAADRVAALVESIANRKG